MAITPVSKDMAVIGALADLPNSTDGLTAAQLKAKFDEGGTALKDYINNTLLPALYATTDGASGADQIGATAVSGLTGSTVQALIEALKTYTDTGLAANAAGNHTGTWQGYSPSQVDQTVRDDLNAHIAKTAADDVHGLAFKGAMAKLSATQSIPNATVTVISWGATEYDTSGFWSAASPTRLTVPSGVSKVRVKGSTSFASITDDTPRYVSFRKNGTGSFAGNAQLYFRNVSDFGYRLSRAVAETAVLNVAAGDYFEMVVSQNSSAALDFLNDSFAWFALEVIQ